MADNSGVRVHVTRVVTYSYDEHFMTDRDEIKKMERSLGDTVHYRDRDYCTTYADGASVSFSEIPA